MTVRSLILLLCTAVISFPLVGCGSSDTHDAAHQEEHGHDHGHDHNHAESGPHGGHLIELGDEAYHLEWKHDEASKTLTFYVLDSTAKEEIEIPAEAIKINVTVGDAANAYDISAVRDEGAEQSAKFETTDPDLFALLEDDHVEATVLVEIEGKQFDGSIEHHHHGHSH